MMVSWKYYHLDTLITFPPFYHSPIGNDIKTRGKNRNCLGIPENYLITPNEYTLNLLPLSPFYVDILDSKISANIFQQDGIVVKNSI